MKRRLSRAELTPAKKRRIEISSAEEDVDYEANKANTWEEVDVVFVGDYAKLSRAKQVAAKKKVIESRKRAKAEALRKQVEQARKQPKLTANTGDKVFTIAFIQMGQGDCSVIRTPGDKIIMIDCGTTASDDEREAQTYQTNVDDNWSASDLTEIDIPELQTIDVSLRVKAVLGTKNKIDFLILTHSDRDHYNQLKGLLGDSMRFGEVYHSNELTKYKTNETTAYIRSHAEKADRIFRVIHNDPESNKIKLQPENGDALELDQESNRGYLLVNEDNCKIWILASDVTYDSVLGLENPITDDGSPTPTNRASVVTLVEAFGKKILICGDATTVTEQYLLATSKDAFQNLDILQVPHHSTRVTSSSQVFINHTNPLNVVVSSARKDQQHKLPQQFTLRKYFLKMKDSNRPLEDKDHEIMYWMQGRSGSPIHCWSTLKRPIYITGSQGSFGWTISRTDGTVKMEFGLIKGPGDETKQTTSTEPEKLVSEGSI